VNEMLARGDLVMTVAARPSREMVPDTVLTDRLGPKSDAGMRHMAHSPPVEHLVPVETFVARMRLCPWTRFPL